MSVVSPDSIDNGSREHVLRLSGFPRLLKRAFDVAAASSALFLLSPLLAIVAAAIKLESRGPVTYRQERIGENGRPFTMLKLRSMHNGADVRAHRAHVTRLIKENASPDEEGDGNGSLKMDADPRVTRVGRFIRRTSIDELPQLVNVLRGEMSLVGPRPPLPYEVDLYQEWHKQRLEALPGITGWWQVKGRNRVSFDEMVRMDLHYIEHRSFWYDLGILLLTPWAVVSGRGAG